MRSLVLIPIPDRSMPNYLSKNNTLGRYFVCGGYTARMDKTYPFRKKIYIVIIFRSCWGAFPFIRWLPFLVDQCAFGWTSNVVLVSDDGGHRPTTWAHKHHLRRRLYLANPGLSFIAGCSGVCVGQEALESILREDAFDTKVMLQVSDCANTPMWRES